MVILFLWVAFFGLLVRWLARLADDIGSCLAWSVLLRVPLVQFHLSFQGGVETILYMVVCSSWEVLGNLGPFISKFLMRLNDGPIFLFSPLVLLYVWVQVIVPPLSALLANSTRQCLGNVAPIFGPKFQHIFRELFILFLAPRPLHHGWIQNLLPTMQALHVCSLIEVRSDLLPVFGTELTHKFGQIKILLGIPVPFGVLGLLAQWIIWISRDVVGFLGCHIQVSLILLVLQHFLHVVIALRKRLLFIGTLLGRVVDKLVGGLLRSLMAGLRRKILSRLNLAWRNLQI